MIVVIPGGVPVARCAMPGCSETLSVAEAGQAMTVSLPNAPRVVIEMGGWRVTATAAGLDALGVCPACRDRAAPTLPDLPMMVDPTVTIGPTR